MCNIYISKRCLTPFILTLLIIFDYSAYANVQPKSPVVVSSIKPLQLIVSAIAGDVVDSQLLLPATISPHLYHLRPSDRLQLQSADLVVWIGPNLEKFLEKTLSLFPTSKTLELGHVMIENDSSRLHSDKLQNNSQIHNHDPHLWLNPLYAIKMAQIIANQLIQIDPNNQLYYQEKMIQFQQRMNEVDKLIYAQFQAISNPQYIVLHDAYGYFEQHYGLKHVAALSVGPEKKPGVKHLLEIRKKIQLTGVSCMFREPQYHLSAENIILKNSNVTIGSLDPLASRTQVSATGYEEFLLDFSSEFQRCLMQ